MLGNKRCDIQTNNEKKYFDTKHVIILFIAL